MLQRDRLWRHGDASATTRNQLVNVRDRDEHPADTGETYTRQGACRDQVPHRPRAHAEVVSRDLDAYETGFAAGPRPTGYAVLLSALRDVRCIEDLAVPARADVTQNVTRRLGRNRARVLWRPAGSPGEPRHASQPIGRAGQVSNARRAIARAGERVWLAAVGHRCCRRSVH